MSTYKGWAVFSFSYTVQRGTQSFIFRFRSPSGLETTKRAFSARPIISGQLDDLTVVRQRGEKKNEKKR